MPGAISIGSPRLASAFAAASRCLSLSASRFASAVARSSAFDGVADIASPCSAIIAAERLRQAGDPVFQRRCDSKPRRPRRTRATPHSRSMMTGNSDRKQKCEAADAVEALDPGVPYESRWAPYVRIHGPGQGQFPKGSIRPRGYMAPDARRSLARANVATMRPDRQRHEAAGDKPSVVPADTGSHAA